MFTHDRARSRMIFTKMISATHQTYYHYFCKGKVRAQEMISASFYWKSFPFVHLWSRAITHDVYLKEMSEKLALYLPCKRVVFVEKKKFLDVHSWSRTITDDVHLKEKSVKVSLYLPCKRNVFVEKSSFLMFTRDRGRSRMMFTWKKRV